MLNLKKITYNDNHDNFVENISVTIPAGSFVKISGDKGAGKNVFLKIIGGVVFPDHGIVTLNNVNISEYKEKFSKPPSAFVFNTAGLISNLTVYENIFLALDYNYPDIENKIKIERIHEELAKFKITGLSSLRPADLTPDEVKLVGLLRALIMEPEMLILQDPLLNVERKNVRSFIKSVSDFYKQGKLVLYTGQNSTKLDDLATLEIELERGSIKNIAHLQADTGE